MFDGRETLRMETVTAERCDIRMKDGTIDADVMVTRRRSFVYVNVRMQNENEAEEFYLGPHKSGLPDAAHYSPAYQGYGFTPARVERQRPTSSLRSGTTSASCSRAGRRGTPPGPRLQRPGDVIPQREADLLPGRCVRLREPEGRLDVTQPGVGVSPAQGRSERRLTDRGGPLLVAGE